MAWPDRIWVGTMVALAAVAALMGNWLNQIVWSIAAVVALVATIYRRRSLGTYRIDNQCCTPGCHAQSVIYTVAVDWRMRAVHTSEWCEEHLKARLQEIEQRRSDGR